MRQLILSIHAVSVPGRTPGTKPPLRFKKALLLGIFSQGLFMIIASQRTRASNFMLYCASMAWASYTYVGLVDIKIHRIAAFLLNKELNQLTPLNNTVFECCLGKWFYKVASI